MKSYRWLMFVAPFLFASLANAAPLPAPEASVVLPAAITGVSACPTKSANAAQLPVLNPAAQQALAAAGTEVGRPGYDIEASRVGIVHLGVGAFTRHA